MKATVIKLMMIVVIKLMMIVIIMSRTKLII